jgi:peroxiredoxin
MAGQNRLFPGLIVLALLWAADLPGAPPQLSSYGAAPAFSRTDLRRKPVNLMAYRGKVVLLNFWATWCEPCLTELPRFRDWQRRYGARGLQVIAISMDDEESPVQDVYRKQSLNFPVVIGDEKLGELYGGVLGVPVTFLIDQEGKIRLKQDGAVDLDAIERAILKLLPR